MFWDMTIAEVERWSRGVAKRKTNQNKELAQIIHLLPQLIASAVGQMFDDKNKYPPIYEVFPDLFEKPTEEVKWERSAINIIQFANSHNQKFKREVKNNE